MPLDIDVLLYMTDQEAFLPLLKLFEKILNTYFFSTILIVVDV